MEQTLYTLAGGVIVTLSTVVGFVYKELRAERARNDALQDNRVADAKEARDKISEPIAQLIALSEKIYDALPENKRGK